MTKLEIEARRCEQALQRLATEVDGYRTELARYDPWRHVQAPRLFEALRRDADTLRGLIVRDTQDFTQELPRQHSRAKQHVINATVRDWGQAVQAALSLVREYRAWLEETTKRMAAATEVTEQTRERLKESRDGARLQAQLLAEQLGEMARRARQCTDGTWLR